MIQKVSAILPRREPLAREVVEACYRVLLGREPESPQIIKEKASFPTYEELIESFVKSEEFAGRASPPIR